MVDKLHNFVNSHPPSGMFYCNKEFKIAYLALRKCGSSSFGRFIAQLKAEEIVHPIWDQENWSVNFDHVTGDEDDLGEYFTFTFVRDPYARFLSFYRHWILSPMSNKRILKHYEKFGFFQDMPFVDCIEALISVPDVALLDEHTVPMYQYVYRKNRRRVKFVGRLENVERDFSFIKSTCSLGGELSHSAAMSRKYATNPYTPESRSLVYKFYRRDFEIFGYQR